MKNSAENITNNFPLTTKTVSILANAIIIISILATTMTFFLQSDAPFYYKVIIYAIIYAPFLVLVTIAKDSIMVHKNSSLPLLALLNLALLLAIILLQKYM